jgi:hypothetical protein
VALLWVTVADAAALQGSGASNELYTVTVGGPVTPIAEVTRSWLRVERPGSPR